MGRSHRTCRTLAYLNCQLTWSELDAAIARETAKELTKITSDRHAIVHEGKKPYIKRDLAEQANTLVASLAHHIDAEVCQLYPPA